MSIQACQPHTKLNQSILLNIQESFHLLELSKTTPVSQASLAAFDQHLATHKRNLGKYKSTTIYKHNCLVGTPQTKAFNQAMGRYASNIDQLTSRRDEISEKVMQQEAFLQQQALSAIASTAKDTPTVMDNSQKLLAETSTAKLAGNSTPHTFIVTQEPPTPSESENDDDEWIHAEKVANEEK